MSPERGVLRVAVGDGPHRAEHERLVRTLLERRVIEHERTLRGSYGERVLAMARTAWKERMRREHHSATVFSGLLPQLIAAGATIDLKTSVLRMAMEELLHAQLCGEVIELLGDLPELDTVLATPVLPDHPSCTPIERALRNVLFIGLNETISVAVLSEERSLVREPAIEAVLTQLLGDEVGHAKLGWVYLRQVWPGLDATQRERTRAYLPFAFAHLERELIAPMRAARFDEALREGLSQLGLLSPQDVRELFYGAIETAVLAPLDAEGLEATRAWRERAALSALVPVIT